MNPRATVLLLAALGAAPAQSALIEGSASLLSDGSPAYLERHRIDGDAHRIDYLAPDGTPIAEKHLDYACSDTAPDWEQRDLRTGEREGGRREGTGYRLLDGGRSRLLPAGGTLVASSGFDRFVRAHWDALAAGQSVDFDFALPSRLDTVRLRIAAAEPPDGAAEHGFEIVAAQPLLRAFVKPIRLGYDGERRLVVYRGLSNLQAPDGGGMQVEIRYSHSGTGAAGGDEPPAGAVRKPASDDCAGERS